MAVKMMTRDSTMASTLGMNLPSRFITGEARAVTRRLRKRARATGKTRFRKKPTTTSPASRMSTRHVMPAARLSVGGICDDAPSSAMGAP